VYAGRGDGVTLWRMSTNTVCTRCGDEPRAGRAKWGRVCLADAKRKQRGVARTGVAAGPAVETGLAVETARVETRVETRRATGGVETGERTADQGGEARGNVTEGAGTGEDGESGLDLRCHGCGKGLESEPADALVGARAWLVRACRCTRAGAAAAELEALRAEVAGLKRQLAARSAPAGRIQPLDAIGIQLSSRTGKVSACGHGEFCQLMVCRAARAGSGP
jgi:hypothetical protein